MANSNCPLCGFVSKHSRQCTLGIKIDTKKVKERYERSKFINKQKKEKLQKNVNSQDPRIITISKEK